MEKEVFRCKSCLNLSTRPRIEFNDKQVCNACLWAEEKKHKVDWKLRQTELEHLLDKYRGRSEFDCIVPVSGGKDSSYVSYMVKHVYKMNPLCITINPPLQFEVGKKNLENFSNAGYNLMAITPDPHIMQRINKIGLIEYGIPMLGWQTAVQTYIPKLAVQLNIPLIFYGEDGEVEYGGTSESKNRMSYTIEYSKNIYLNGTFHKALNERFTPQELGMFSYPTEEQILKNNVIMLHWSYFENWNSEHNYQIAKEHFNLEDRDTNLDSGSYTKGGQNDTCLYDLHVYLMFLKFGFGRACQDAGIDIRRGALSREEGIELVKKYDDWRPYPYFDQYFEYYQITREELEEIFDKFANKNLLHKVDGKWIHKKYIF